MSALVHMNERPYMKSFWFVVSVNDHLGDKHISCKPTVYFVLCGLLLIIVVYFCVTYITVRKVSFWLCN